MQFVPPYPPQYMQANPMVLYPNEMPVSYNQQFGLTDDLLVAGQREAESRGRRRITRQQATILENAFNENQKPNRNIRLELAQILAISPRNVQVFHTCIPGLTKDLVPKQASKSKGAEEVCRTTHARSP
jgi:hypothetical protein